MNRQGRNLSGARDLGLMFVANLDIQGCGHRQNDLDLDGHKATPCPPCSAAIGSGRGCVSLDDGDYMYKDQTFDKVHGRMSRGGDDQV